MRLVQIIEQNEGFLLESTKTNLPRKEVTPIGEAFHVRYPIENFRMDYKRVRRAARKKGFSLKAYNVYTSDLDGSLSPIQAKVQLYLIPEKLVRAEIKKDEEIAGELAGY